MKRIFMLYGKLILSNNVIEQELDLSLFTEIANISYFLN